MESIRNVRRSLASKNDSAGSGCSSNRSQEPHFAKERVDGRWMHKYASPLRQWIQIWLMNKSAGGNPVSPRSFGASDWQSVEPVQGLYAGQYDKDEQ